MQRLRGRDQALPVGAAGGWAERVRLEEPRAPSVGTQGPRPCLQVDMLYEEALYTVLHRAGTMGPPGVDDEEALLSYLQGEPQALPTGWPGPPPLGWPRHFPPACVTVASATQSCPTYLHTQVHRQTRQADRHAQEGGHKHIQTEEHTEDTAPKNIEKTGRQM